MMPEPFREQRRRYPESDEDFLLRCAAEWCPDVGNFEDVFRVLARPRPPGSM
jgi:hypothetical protein